MKKNEIGTDAGVIWNLLLENGRMSVNDIMQKVPSDDNNISLAIGWLAKENKIELVTFREELFIELSHSASEYYY